MSGRHQRTPSDPVLSNSDIIAFLAGQLADCENHWSLGTFGALAEFTRDVAEPVTITREAHAVTAVTERGGLRLEATQDTRLTASESATRTSWNHRVALCQPEASSAMGRRDALTELGPDEEALRPQDRAAILFDLGLDALQADACIRVSDPELAATLRNCTGRNVFEAGNPAMSFIVSAGPHRVFISRVGRIEVFQPIPPPDGKSPEGPHTHVLPKLLRHKRTHAATEPIPQGWVPCAHLYPAHPVKDGLGRPLDFEMQRHERFQAMLDLFGDPDAVKLKQQVISAVECGSDPFAATIPADRIARAITRVALRQLQMSRGASAALASWLQAFDRALIDDMSSEEAVQGHP